MSDRIGALYIRVSTDDQAELSPDAQKRLLLDYAKKNAIIISNDFIFSESVSGRHVQKRPEFQRMIGIAKQPSHPIDVILVWKYSRFARNQEESIVYKSMLKKDHVEVISVSEPLIDGPFGSLIERIIEWMDEYYSIRLSGEVLRGMKEKALRNGYQSSPCLGYEAVGHGKPYQINEAEYAMVSYIMDLYDNQNMDETAIARKCNDLGYKTKRGNPFERRTIDRILQNPFYCGIVSWNGVEFEGAHEVRISKERFDRRQRLITSRKRPMKARNISTCKHWLSGLLKCSVCGATLSYTGNGKCPYFQCWKYAKGFHKTSVALSVKKAEEAVIEYFDQVLAGADFTYVRKEQPAADETAAIEQLQKELSKLSARESRIRDAYESGIDSLEEYKANKERLISNRLQLETELEKLRKEQAEKEVNKEDVLHEIKSVNDILKNPDVSYEEKGTLIRTIVDQIVYDKESGKMYFDIIVS
ncbi:recombinase family protein [Blautia obeum]|jgi:site-specific DNA recombinase|uniref:Recombinase family protein n=1 Tax=Blautia obeum TaxID=40520 RepID=A0A414SEV7_9FIRM|nr:recombinase family protein [Blautia obeum]MED9825762.1 recombinase family protein [Blautia faecis]RHG17726.1 recombinase family protein [Blautia obeum]RHH19568.1 recombinase family protein [Blautia obeum]DAZ07923.1 MAG TPA: integrase [Caudoviricetes sp.]